MGKVFALEAEIAKHAAATGDDRCLAAARVIEGLRTCLDAPIECSASAPKTVSSQLGQVASDLRGIARQHGANGADYYPSDTGRADRAAEELLAAVRGAIDRKMQPSGIALTVEFARACHKDIGTAKLLPHAGTAEERLAAFTTAIDEVRAAKARDASWEELGIDPAAPNLADALHSRPLKQDDAPAVLRACARACGFTGDPLQFLKKRAFRQPQEG